MLTIFSNIFRAIFIYVYMISLVHAEQQCASALKLVKRSQIDAFSQQESLNDLRKAIEQCPTLVEAHYELGRISLTQGEFSQAEESFKKANELQKRVEHSVGIAVSYQLRGDYVASENTYKEALVSYLGDWKLLEGLALLYLETGKLQSAEDLLRQALQERPLEPSVYFHLGQVLERRKQYDEALVSYKSAIDRNYNYPDAFLKPASLMFKLGYIDRAINLSQNGLVTFQNDSDILLLLANLYSFKKEFTQARNYLKKIRGKKQIVSLHLHTIDIIESSDPSPSLNKLKKLYENIPSDSNDLHIPRAYGWALAYLGKNEEALSVLKNNIAKYPGDMVSKKNLAILYHRLGKLDEAEKIISTNKENFIFPLFQLSTKFDSSIYGSR